jgi:hypothetical protein
MHVADAWMKFYPQDWRADERLRNCGLAARGLWMEMLALMHRSERYGYLLINGKPPTDRQLAVQVGASLTTSPSFFPSSNPRPFSAAIGNGTIYSRRMIRDEKKAQNARATASRAATQALGKTSKISASDNQELNLSDNGGDKAQKPEARSQKPEGDYSLKPSPTTSREPPPPGHHRRCERPSTTSASLPTGNDHQRQQALDAIANWFSLGCSIELILGGIGLALERDPSPTRSLKRFDTTIRGMRRDQLGGELPPTGDDVRRSVSDTARRVSVQ